MAFQFRRCTVADLNTLRDLSIEIFCETFAPLNTPENMDAYVQSAYTLPKLRREMEDPKQEFYFAYADGILAGYLKVNEAPSQSEINDPNALELERIYVQKNFSGQVWGNF